LTYLVRWITSKPYPIRYPMESHFYLQNKGSKESQIYHFIYCGFSKPIKYYVGKRINPSEKIWNYEKERGIGSTYKSLNFFLDSLEAKANNIYLDLKLNGGLTPDNFMFRLKGAKSDGKDFVTLYKEFIEESKSIRAYSTIQKYTSAINHLIAFQEHTKNKIIIANIDLKFYDKFSAYLMGKDLNNNSVGSIIKNLKVFLVNAKKRGVEVKADLKEFKVLAEKKEVLYHSQEEVEILYNLKIPENLNKYIKIWNQSFKKPFPDKETLIKAKDIHILECQTSLRVSDRKRLGIQHIKDSIIRMPAHKNKKQLTIPLTPKAKAILKKYDYKLPAITEQRSSEYVKAICLIAGFDYLVEIADYRGGKKNYTKVPKWKLVTNHIAVKTFITHCGEKGISAKVVSEITGKTVKVIIDHYYGTNEKVIEAEMKKAFG
jgi:integrase